LKIEDWIRERGPLTVAAFMDLALYHPRFGYYARAPQRSGRAGDFFTSVDVGPLFGELLAIQIAEMFALLQSAAPRPSALNPQPAAPPAPSPPFDLIEAGAGSGRLAADILRAARASDRTFYDSVRLHLVESSAAAREAQPATLGDLADRLHASTDTLPASFEGVLFANELLDAMPVHQVVMRDDGLREVFVAADGASAGCEDRSRRPALRLIEREPSTPELQAYLDRVGARLQPGWRAEIGLRAAAWVGEAARRLRRGFMILIDYGHEARELYSASHSAGTLTTFSRHRSAGPETNPRESEGFSRPLWLARPGEQDITAHVDFTTIRKVAETEGLTTIAFLDQTYFLLGLSSAWNATLGQAPGRPERRRGADWAGRGAALKTLVLPGGLGSIMKVLILGKNVGRPALNGCSFSVRVT
jgi:SAM-dependent MidA family methyltransferase